jgi:hypothetical protein
MAKIPKTTKFHFKKKLPQKNIDWCLALMSGQELRIGYCQENITMLSECYHNFKNTIYIIYGLGK